MDVYLYQPDDKGGKDMSEWCIRGRCLQRHAHANFMIPPCSGLPHPPPQGSPA